MRFAFPLLLALTSCQGTLDAANNIVVGFDRYDGRWVADLGPHPGTCCPTRLVLDVDGRRFSGSSQDCHGTSTVVGKMDKAGSAILLVNKVPGTAHFSGENFSAEIPGLCPVPINGNRGG